MGEQPVASKASSVEQRIDEVIKELTGKSTLIPKNYRAKQQILSLIQARDEQREIDIRIDELNHVAETDYLYTYDDRKHSYTVAYRLRELEALKNKGKTV